VGQPGLEDYEAPRIEVVSPACEESLDRKRDDEARNGLAAGAFGPAIGPGDGVGVALAKALEAATAAGNFKLVAAIVAELGRRGLC
jgi:hypothetical protein